MAEITVIGIDPGSRLTGWGIVREVSGQLELVDCGLCKPNPKLPFAQRLAEIFHELHEVIVKYKPNEAAVEQVFTGNNISTALKLGQARGVAIAACASFCIPVTDYEPTIIKKNIVGTGRAEKEQVAYMVKRLLNIKLELAIDTSDALGAAICHLNARRLNMLK